MPVVRWTLGDHGSAAGDQVLRATGRMVDPEVASMTRIEQPAGQAELQPVGAPVGHVEVLVVVVAHQLVRVAFEVARVVLVHETVTVILARGESDRTSACSVSFSGRSISRNS